MIDSELIRLAVAFETLSTLTVAEDGLVAIYITRPPGERVLITRYVRGDNGTLYEDVHAVDPEKGPVWIRTDEASEEADRG